MWDRRFSDAPDGQEAKLATKVVASIEAKVISDEALEPRIGLVEIEPLIPDNCPVLDEPEQQMLVSLPEAIPVKKKRGFAKKIKVEELLESSVDVKPNE